MGEAIVKDITKIYSTLFDHKPVLRREIDYFVKEFEEKRKDREIDNLFHILERVTELKDTEIPKAKSLADIHLPKISAELHVAESISDKLVQKEVPSEDSNLNKLKCRRQDRALEWDAFVHDMTNKCIRIDNLFKSKEEEVRELYQKAEIKLSASSNSNNTE